MSKKNLSVFLCLLALNLSFFSQSSKALEVGVSPGAFEDARNLFRSASAPNNSNLFSIRNRWKCEFSVVGFYGYFRVSYGFQFVALGTGYVALINDTPKILWTQVVSEFEAPTPEGKTCGKYQHKSALRVSQDGRIVIESMLIPSEPYAGENAPEKAVFAQAIADPDYFAQQYIVCSLVKN